MDFFCSSSFDFRSQSCEVIALDSIISQDMMSWAKSQYTKKKKKTIKEYKYKSVNIWLLGFFKINKSPIIMKTKVKTGLWHANDPI